MHWDSCSKTTPARVLPAQELSSWEPEVASGSCSEGRQYYQCPLGVTLIQIMALLPSSAGGGRSGTQWDTKPVQPVGGLPSSDDCRSSGALHSDVTYLVSVYRRQTWTVRDSSPASQPVHCLFWEQKVLGDNLCTLGLYAPACSPRPVSLSGSGTKGPAASFSDGPTNNISDFRDAPYLVKHH